jgi:L-fuconate dehydratase
VQQAIDEMRALAHLKPAWIEEPISPDDAVGQGVIAAALNEHVPSCAVASGEQCSNKVCLLVAARCPAPCTGARGCF